MISALPLVTHPSSLLLPRLRDKLSRGVDAVRAVTRRGWRRVRTLRREHLFWAALLILFALYALALVLQPTAAGRGGR